MNILADASLPGLEEAFPAPFILSRYHTAAQIPELLPNQHILLCRSTLKVNQALLGNHHLNYVATASSGTDHLDHNYLKSQNTSIIDAKGSNAASVADYVTFCLAYLDQQQLIKGKKAGIVGMGQVGNQVFNTLKSMNYSIEIYDPPKAQQDGKFESCSLARLFQCDLICIHAELHNNEPYPSFNLMDQYVVDHLKPGCIIINAARGGIINEEALLNSSQGLIYCTDVYLNEPQINEKIIAMATLCTPHIAGHSLEAKYKAVAQVSEQLHRLAGLPIPKFAKPSLASALFLQKKLPWEKQILSIYNPITESMQLKQALDKQATFIELRKKHNKRHDLSIYLNWTLS